MEAATDAADAVYDDTSSKLAMQQHEQRQNARTKERELTERRRER